MNWRNPLRPHDSSVVLWAVVESNGYVFRVDLPPAGLRSLRPIPDSSRVPGNTSSCLCEALPWRGRRMEEVDMRLN